jgi:hypothetical protein
MHVPHPPRDFSSTSHITIQLPQSISKSQHIDADLNAGDSRQNREINYCKKTKGKFKPCKLERAQAVVFFTRWNIVGERL